MRCPACGSENTTGAAKCVSCGHSFGSKPGSSSGVTIRLSVLAVISAAVAILSWLCIVPPAIAAMDRYLLSPESALVNLTFLSTLFGGGLGFILGVIALIDIQASGGRKTGYGFAAIGVAGPAVLILAMIYVPMSAGKSLAPRMTCGTNLAGIGKAMLIYANDYDDKLPVAGGQGTAWGPGLADWRAERRAEAFGLDPNSAGGQATISSSLYLLVRYGDVPPKSFVCMGERGAKAFDPTKYRIDGDRLTDVWDFGPNPARHCSYAYQQPYGPYVLTTYSKPGSVVAADHNPWIDSVRWKADDFSVFRSEVTATAETKKDASLGNVKAHMRDGQNVLFLDSHVEFAQQPCRGIEKDNIYTSWDGEDKMRGMPPKPYESQPADALDSLLLNDPALKR